MRSRKPSARPVREAAAGRVSAVAFASRNGYDPVEVKSIGLDAAPLGQMLSSMRSDSIPVKHALSNDSN